MKKYLLTLATFIFLIGTTYSQNYSPLKKGNEWAFKMQNATYTTKVLDSFFTYKEVEYFQSETKYSWGMTEINYFRIDEEGNEIYLDSKSFTETVNMPSRIELGHAWISTDKTWKYEISGLNETLNTPEKIFKNCIIIKAEQLTGRDKGKLPAYYNYYADGIGYVGSKSEQGLVTYLTNYSLK